MNLKTISIIGGGLAGCEAAYQAARRGHRVNLYEMRFTGKSDRPVLNTPAHQTGLLAELVCSNSLKSTEPGNAHGLLKGELARLDSLLLKCARKVSLPAGKALAVDRDKFALAVTLAIGSDPNIKIISEEQVAIPEGPTVIASGPLTSEKFSRALVSMLGEEGLFFFDAIAPIVEAGSLDHSKMFKASRYSDEEGQYWNAPLSKKQYHEFVKQLAAAERHQPRDFEAGHYYEGCLPVEALAERNVNSLRFGMMKPVGLFNPHEGRRPYAVLQLRQENLEGTMFNLVGFQTLLKISEQQRIFRMIPGLEQAHFLRYGSMHRNTYLQGPSVLHATMQSKARDDLFFAGQLTGVEGYGESIATGLLAGINVSRHLKDQPLLIPPPLTMLGALCKYVSEGGTGKSFQPMNANFGLLPPLENSGHSKKQRSEVYSQRALKAMEGFVEYLSS
ncbi:methylenetetrahydrofolate--tRNA-(uracil(54)-C(5))-methyltransferase (FADH(2)-oxidizing) TrmFO [candidate division TA06 bacterium]|uniref:Methylenetetrahydrofolate--tRNA-(uracil-5-)-methyltransferase TrmFO n=1 Tax=candidate division TA06 bacterium TaxID=2250710 RepID=A0A933IB95_UNCT6|nr:methylenetetrahydrofolate--tRNA-(uracil(54)-C(5))-methyltransferase (FADH(2)-oxidizing) TrmFO [candidate division TA06 bacterium]